MGQYENKTKEELLQIIEKLEKEVDGLSTELASVRSDRFREKYSTRILDALPDMLTVFDHDANIVELASSPNTNHVEGTTSESIVHSNVKDIVPPEAYESIRENMDKVIDTGKSSIAKHSLYFDGLLHHYENRIFPLDDDHLLCMCRDVSQQTYMEEINTKQQNEIMRLNTLLEAILTNIPVYLFVKDPNNDFRYLYWNKTFAEYSGIPMEKAVGKNDYEIFSRSEDMEKFRQDDLKTLEEGKLDYFEEYMTATGEIRTVNTMKRKILVGDDKYYIIGIAWDVTDIKKTEKELIAARIKAEEADKLKSAFLANMSHEIRTPLNAIVGFSKLVIEGNTNEETCQYADIIEKNSNILLNLFSDILDLAALEAGSLKFNIQSLRLHDICLQAYQQFHKITPHEVKLILDEVDTNVFVQADWERITQVICNLLSNAIKFTPKGEIHYGYQKKENYILFYVKDTGIGIPAHKAATIFQRFGKINDFVQGTGLGLTLCRMLVEKMGGHIWLRSVVGQGTTFYFTLPGERN